MVFLGDCVDYVAGVEQLGLRTLLFLTLLQVQPAHRRCVGKGKERHLWAASVLHFGLVYLFFLFFFSMSVQTKIQRGFLNWRFVRIWEGDYLFDGFAWIRCFMTVSKHDRHRGSVHLFCGIATSFRGCFLDTRWVGIHDHALFGRGRRAS